MEVYEKYLVEAMASAVKGVTPPPPSEPIDFDIFYKKAREHKIENIVLKYVCDNIGMFSGNTALLNAWKQMSLISSVSLIQLGKTVERITSRFEEEGLSVILLKGSVLKSLYPRPEMRTMGDTDIIIKKEELDRVRKIFEENGYTEEPDKDGNPQFMKENNYKFEAFFELRTIDNLWEKADNIKGKSFVYKLSPEMFLFHLVSHLAKHIRYTGAGIRNLCDIYLVMEKWDIDYEKVRSELENRKLNHLFDTIIKILEIYFGFESDKIKSAADEATAVKLMEFMIRYGVFGFKSEGNVFTRSQKSKILSKKDRMIENIRMFFPKADRLSEKYSYAVKYPLLLPVAWVHRLFVKRFVEKRTMAATVKEMGESGVIMDYQNEIIKEFNL